MNRLLYELEIRAGVLRQFGDELRDQCISIARNKSPSASVRLAGLIATQSGLSGMTVIAVGKATRWLSVIRRDHGNKKFAEAVTKLKSPGAIVAMGKKGGH